MLRVVVSIREPHCGSPQRGPTVPIRKKAIPRLGLSPGDWETLENDFREGRMYTFDEIAERLHCSYGAVRNLFMKEPGVVKLNSTYRVPESVYQGVLARRANK